MSARPVICLVGFWLLGETERCRVDVLGLAINRGIAPESLTPQQCILSVLFIVHTLEVQPLYLPLKFQNLRSIQYKCSLVSLLVVLGHIIKGSTHNNHFTLKYISAYSSLHISPLQVIIWKSQQFTYISAYIGLFILCIPVQVVCYNKEYMHVYQCISGWM